MRSRSRQLSVKVQLWTAAILSIAWFYPLTEGFGLIAAEVLDVIMMPQPCPLSSEPINTFMANRRSRYHSKSDGLQH